MSEATPAIEFDIVLVYEDGRMRHYVRYAPIDKCIILPSLNVKWLVFPVAR